MLTPRSGNTPYTIDASCFYDDAMLRRNLGVRLAALVRARESGELRYTRRGGRILYFGQWVLDWLTSDAATETTKPAPRRGVTTPARGGRWRMRERRGATQRPLIAGTEEPPFAMTAEDAADPAVQTFALMRRAELRWRLPDRPEDPPRAQRNARLQRRGPRVGREGGPVTSIATHLRAARPAIAGLLLGVRPYDLRRLVLGGDLDIWHVGGRPLVIVRLDGAFRLGRRCRSGRATGPAVTIDGLTQAKAGSVESIEVEVTERRKTTAANRGPRLSRIATPQTPRDMPDATLKGRAAPRV